MIAAGVRAAALGVIGAVLGGPLAAQTAAAPPPPSGPRPEAREAHELLPDLGLIGGQAAITGGSCVDPYGNGAGVCGGGFLAVPVARVLGGRLSYQIDVSLGRSVGKPFMVTNALAYIANLAAGASPAAAAAGPPAAPFPVRREVRTELRILQVAPFGLRYAFAGSRVPTVRPYLVAGGDVLVVLSSQEPVGGGLADPLGSAAFDAPLLGGLVAEAPELDALGLPAGQGNLRVGVHAGLGVELRVSGRLSVNAEYRATAIEGADRPRHAVQGALGLHW
jgi:hypothetical protein